MEEKGQRGEGERRGEVGRVGEEEELEGGVPKVMNFKKEITTVFVNKNC